MDEAADPSGLGRRLVSPTKRKKRRKWFSVVTDLFGKSPRAMLEALVNGERNPRRLAQRIRPVEHTFQADSTWV